MEYPTFCTTCIVTAKIVNLKVSLVKHLLSYSISFYIISYRTSLIHSEVTFISLSLASQIYKFIQINM